MSTIPIVPKNLEKQSLEPKRASHSTLPLFYMSDFSIMGLRVNPYHEAIKALEKRNHRLKIDHTGVKLVVEDFDGLKEVIRQLQKEEIQCDLSDIVTDIYQG